MLALRWITDNNDRHQEGSDGVWWNLNIHMDEWSCSDLHLETKCISSSLILSCMNWLLCCSWTTQTQFSCTRLLKIILPPDCKSRSVFCSISSTDLSLHVVELTAPLFQFSHLNNIVSTHCNKLVSEISQCGRRGWAAGRSAPFRRGNVRHSPLQAVERSRSHRFCWNNIEQRDRSLRANVKQTSWILTSSFTAISINLRFYPPTRSWLH